MDFLVDPQQGMGIATNDCGCYGVNCNVYCPSNCNGNCSSNCIADCAPNCAGYCSGDCIGYCKNVTISPWSV